jgi:hypothetical protein
VDSSTSLHGFADIVGYSQLAPYQQAASQERLIKVIDESLADAGVRPDSVQVQNQGDARMLAFPDVLDVSRLLAIMPRRLNDELKAYNRDVADRARLRVRLSFVMGATAPGAIGRVGNAPITAVRLNGASPLRAAMMAEPNAYLGVIIDDGLYREHVAQAFRPDLDEREYAPAHVSIPGKRFEADAWFRLVGYPASTLPGQRRPAVTLPAEAVSHVGRLETSVGEPEEDDPDETGTSQTPTDGGAGAARRRRERRRLTVAWATVIGAGITAAVSVGIYLASDHPGAGTPQGTLSPSASVSASSSPSATTFPTASASGSNATGTPPPTAGVVTMYADWYLGVNVYADNEATTSNAPVIPFNQQVEVSCVAPNNSGILSINAFYLLASGPWKGTYASANEFTNGGARKSGDDPAIDASVKPCPGSS